MDIDCIENKIVKELGVYETGQTVEYSFLPPNKFKTTSQSAWFMKQFHGINCSSGHETYTELEKVLKKIKIPEMEFFA